MATGPDLSSSSAAGAASSSAAKKDRHIVSWSAEEDDVLRAQIAHHGTDNWTIIATQFKDKTARQCRRRWYNYLNTECKKGGWSREEDMLLCEAQKLLGNKWTEIAKVVSGRTDNAVKNRFTTLCKKRGKDEELFKENGALCSNANSKRVLTQTGCLTSGAAGSSPPTKQMRSCSFKENIAPNMRLFGQEKSTQQDSRQPLAIISPENQYSVNIMGMQNLVAKTSTEQLYGGEQSCVKHEGNFLKKDDPKFATLLQQADLLCSLATKLNTENTSQSMDEAWQQLQHHLVKKDDNDMSESSMSGTASLLEELDALIVDPYENEEEDEQKSREQNGQIDVDDEHSNGPSQTSMQVTSPMAPDQKMDNCPVDKSTEESSLCRDMFSSSMEPCPGTEIPAYVNLGEAAEDSMLCCMEYTSPAHTVLQAKADAEIPVSINLSEAAEGSWPQCMEYMSPAHTVSQAKADAEIPAPINLSESAKDSSLQCTEYTSPAHTVLQAKADAERSSPENFSEVAKDSRLQFIKFTSPDHTAIEGKAGAEMPVLENCSDVAKDSSKLPCMEFTSPAHTVPTFQLYPDDMPTPKITASERNFLLSVLELTSPGSRPDTSQQPSCKRALLNSL